MPNEPKTREIKPEELDSIRELEESHENNFDFSLSLVEQLTGRAWMTTHDVECSIRDMDTAIGGRWSFTFTKMTLGNKCTVKCACGQEKDVTDYGCW